MHLTMWIRWLTNTIPPPILMVFTRHSWTRVMCMACAWSMILHRCATSRCWMSRTTTCCVAWLMWIWCLCVWCFRWARSFMTIGVTHWNVWRMWRRRRKIWRNIRRCCGMLFRPTITWCRWTISWRCVRMKGWKRKLNGWRRTGNCLPPTPSDNLPICSWHPCMMYEVRWTMDNGQWTKNRNATWYVFCRWAVRTVMSITKYWLWMVWLSPSCRVENWNPHVGCSSKSW